MYYRIIYYHFLGSLLVVLILLMHELNCLFSFSNSLNRDSTLSSMPSLDFDFFIVDFTSLLLDFLWILSVGFYYIRLRNLFMLLLLSIVRERISFRV